MKTSDRQSVMRDFLEAFGPVMPVAGEDAGALVGDWLWLRPVSTAQPAAAVLA
jgi:hypothetical protein